jgi:LmbE family N-acetylglucosaminyl deacetylase
MRVAHWFLVVALGAPAFATERSKSILAVFAHPDDETLVGPLLAAYGRQGVKVHLVIVTDGEKGAFPHSGIPAGPELARKRADEARCSCRELGIEPPTLLGFKDGELGRLSRPPWGYLAEAEVEISNLLAKLQPSVIVTFGPEGGYGHPDHRLVGSLVTQVVQAGGAGASVALFYPGLPKDRLPVHPGRLPWSPTDRRFLTVRVPYNRRDLEATRKALACHQTQFAAEEAQQQADWLDAALGGVVYLRPWFAASTAEDLFKVKFP